MLSYAIQWSEPVNAELLHEQLAAELGDVFAGLVIADGRVRAHFDETVADVTPDLLERALDVLKNHDRQARTARQAQAEADAEQARRFQDLVDERIAWHRANPLTAANAVAVAARMQEEWVYFLHMLRSGEIRF